MSRMREVIRGVEKDVFDKAFDAFNKDAQIAKGEFHISGIVATGDVTRQFILEGLELRRETKQNLVASGVPEFDTCSPARAIMFAGTALGRVLSGATHVIESSKKIITQGSMDKLQMSLEANRFVPSATEARNAKATMERLNDIAKE